MKKHSNYKRMCSRKEQEEGKFYLTSVMPEFGPDNEDWHLRENVPNIECAICAEFVISSSIICTDAWQRMQEMDAG